MSKEQATDQSVWRHRKELYEVEVIHSAPQGVTLFRRVVALPSGSRRLRTKQTKAFVREFEKVKP